ncbi:MAG: class II aldolase/adducin family protein [Bacteroidia bacterium]|nr:class II aldolase/adducin family protein [Bacteroidia bacterium]
MSVKKLLQQSPAVQLSEIMTRIYNGMMTTPTGGNISIRDEEGNLWVTPTQIDKGRLTPADMVKIYPDGRTEA